MSEEYTTDLQKLYLEFLLSEKDLFVRCNAITNKSYFSREFRPVVAFIQEHVDKYGDLPTTHQIKAKTSNDFDDISDKITDDHKKWFMDEYEKFCRHKAIQNAILESSDMLERHEYGSVEQLIRDAVGVGLAKDFGINYWDDPVGRIQRIKDNRGHNSTGWTTVDAKLYGGINPGELVIWAGGSGSGKSLFMQNMALNWALDGKNVVYVSLELSEELCSMRLDAMLTNMSTKDVMKKSDDVALKVGMAGKKSGMLQIVQMPNGCTVVDIKAMLKEFQIQNNVKVDALLVDYLDLMMPFSVKVNPSDQFIKDKYVSEELRNLATELQILFVTASQLNRCLSTDTKVIRNGVEIEIKDVEVGDWLESNDGPVQVYEKLPITKQHVYRIKTKSGKEIVCSGNHKFPVDGKLKTINGGLKVGDYLRTTTNNNSNVFEIDDEIIEIEYIGEQDTIDINTTGNRLFYANNILTHNSAVEEVEFDHSHIAGGISKINTADTVIGIFSSRAMRERGRVQIQFMKTRSSSGVGTKLDLGYDMETLRITDLDEDQQSEEATTTSIYQNLKQKTTISTGKDVTEMTDADNSVEDRAAKLRNLLRKSE